MPWRFGLCGGIDEPKHLRFVLRMVRVLFLRGDDQPFAGHVGEQLFKRRRPGRGVRRDGPSQVSRGNRVATPTWVFVHCFRQFEQRGERIG